MNQTELTNHMAVSQNMPKSAAHKFIVDMLDTIEKTTAKGEKVKLIGFGTFTARKRGARVGRNPQTGEPIQIAEHRLPVFKAGNAFKNTLN